MRRAFTLVDVLVSIAVIGILIGLLMPGLARVNSQSRRVLCTSNIRQIGLGLAMYASDFHGLLPPSVHLSPPNGATAAPQEMMELRLSDLSQAVNNETWDGLGFLFKGEYLSAPKLFYCPSHRGNHPFSLYANKFGVDYAGGVVCNYHFRGIGPNGTRNLYLIEPSESAIVADGMATKMDYNHRIGINILRADQVVEWYDDPLMQLADSLPDDENSPGSSTAVSDAWKKLDKGHGGDGGDGAGR